jgi:predicted cupin superfamily sugar epimerase
MLTADDVVRTLDLTPHPIEGGYFRETWRSRDAVRDRSVGTAIYYLLSGAAVSEMHRLPGDEVFHFYLGDPVRQLHLYPDGTAKEFVLGADLAAGQVPQVVVPGGAWQGACRLAGPHGFSLLGATMAPGFDYADYATGPRGELTAKWPEYAGMIELLTPRG